MPLNCMGYDGDSCYSAISEHHRWKLGAEEETPLLLPGSGQSAVYCQRGANL